MVGPGKKDVVGAMHKYCEEDANEAEDGEKGGWMIGKMMPMSTMAGWIRGPLQVIVVVAHAPLGHVVVATARRFSSHSLAHIIVDVGTRNTGIAWARALVHPAKPDHILRIVVSIARHQRASGADDAGNAHPMTFGGTSASSI